MAPEATTKMTQGVTTLAADLASFSNIPMDDALNKIRAAMVTIVAPARYS